MIAGRVPPPLTRAQCDHAGLALACCVRCCPCAECGAERARRARLAYGDEDVYVEGWTAPGVCEECGADSNAPFRPHFRGCSKR